MVPFILHSSVISDWHLGVLNASYSTYDLEAASRQSDDGSSDCLGEICALLVFVFLDHVQKLKEKQVDPQPLHSYWLLIKRRDELCDSSLNLLRKYNVISQ